VIIVTRESYLRALKKHPAAGAAAALVSSQAAATTKALATMQHRIDQNTVMPHLKELFAAIVHGIPWFSVVDMPLARAGFVFRTWRRFTRGRRRHRKEQRMLSAKMEERTERWVLRKRLEREVRSRQEDVTLQGSILREEVQSETDKERLRLPDIPSPSKTDAPSPYLSNQRGKSTSPRGGSRTPRPVDARRRFENTFFTMLSM